MGECVCECVRASARVWSLSAEARHRCYRRGSHSVSCTGNAKGGLPQTTAGGLLLPAARQRAGRAREAGEEGWRGEGGERERRGRVVGAAGEHFIAGESAGSGHMHVYTRALCSSSPEPSHTAKPQIPTPHNVRDAETPQAPLRGG